MKHIILFGYYKSTLSSIFTSHSNYFEVYLHAHDRDTSGVNVNIAILPSRELKSWNSRLQLEWSVTTNYECKRVVEPQKTQQFAVKKFK